MPISLSHLGEMIVTEMAERERTPIVDALDLTELADIDHVRSVRQFAFCECKLSRHHGYIFDGASRVDVVPLSRNWFVITRQSVLDKRVGNDRPSFSQNTSCVTIGALAAAFGGQQPFNALVRELLAIDYFDEWVN